MKTRLVLAFLVPGILFTFCRVSRAGDDSSKALKDLAEKVEALEKAVESLQKRLDAIEKKLEESDSPAFEPPSRFPPFRPSSLRKSLKDIRLPDNPSKEECRDYVKRILATTTGRHSFSSLDQEIELLTRIPREHLDVLCEEMKSGFLGMSNFYVVEAIKRIVQEEDIPTLREYLPQSQSLVSIIADKGWESAFEDILLRELGNGAGYLPVEWIQASARLHKPSSYPDLLDYLLHGMNPGQTLEAIESIPDFPRGELAKAIAKLWDQEKSARKANSFPPSSDWQKRAVAKAAARYGHVDALGYCIQKLNEKPTEPYGYDRELRPLVLRLVKVRMGNKELLDWFERNEDKLRFDPKSGRFELEEEKSAQEDEEGDEGF